MILYHGSNVQIDAIELHKNTRKSSAIWKINSNFAPK